MSFLEEVRAQASNSYLPPFILETIKQEIMDASSRNFTTFDLDYYCQENKISSQHCELIENFFLSENFLLANSKYSIREVNWKYNSIFNFIKERYSARIEDEERAKYIQNKCYLKSNKELIILYFVFDNYVPVYIFGNNYSSHKEYNFSVRSQYDKYQINFVTEKHLPPNLIKLNSLNEVEDKVKKLKLLV